MIKLDTSKQIIEKSRRASKSKDVVFGTIIVTNKIKDAFGKSSLSWTKQLKVMDGKKVKYHVKITSDGIFNSCSCPSFKFGMKYPMPEDQTVPFSSLYFAEHGHTFHCKHILAAIDSKDNLMNFNNTIENRDIVNISTIEFDTQPGDFKP